MPGHRCGSEIRRTIGRIQTFLTAEKNAARAGPGGGRIVGRAQGPDGLSALISHDKNGCPGSAVRINNVLRMQGHRCIVGSEDVHGHRMVGILNGFHPEVAVLAEGNAGEEAAQGTRSDERRLREALADAGELGGRGGHRAPEVDDVQQLGILPVVVIAVLVLEPLESFEIPPTETGPCPIATISPLGALNCV